MRNIRKIFGSILATYTLAQGIYLSVFFTDIVKYGVRETSNCSNPAIVVWEYPRRTLSPYYSQDNNDDQIESYPYKVRRQKIYTTCGGEGVAYTGLEIPLYIQSGTVLTLPKIYNDPKLYTRVGSYLCQSGIVNNTMRNRSEENQPINYPSYNLIHFFAKDFFIINNYLLEKSFINPIPISSVFLTDGQNFYNPGYNISQSGEYNQFYEKNTNIDPATRTPLPWGFSVDKNKVYMQMRTLSGIDSKGFRLLNGDFFAQGSGIYQVTPTEEKDVPGKRRFIRKYGNPMVESSEEKFECD